MKKSQTCNMGRLAQRIKYSQVNSMKFLNVRRHAAFRCAISVVMMVGLTVNVPANPTGLTVSSGVASTHQSGSQLTIIASQNAFLNWNTFNIAAGEPTIFQQPSRSEERRVGKECRSR